MIKIKGLDKLQKQLNDLKKLEKEEKVSFDILFNENFMKKYTNFSSIDELLDKCSITTAEDIEKNIEILNTEIKNNSKFNSWNELKGQATKEHIEKKIHKIFK